MEMVSRDINGGWYSRTTGLHHNSLEELDTDPEFGRILKEVEVSDTGLYVIAWHWVGKPITKIDWSGEIEEYTLGIGDSYYIGTIKVKIIAEEMLYRIVVRQDVRFVERWFYLLRHHLKELNMKLLWTARIWGLLDTKLGLTPKWKDLKILRKFNRV